MLRNIGLFHAEFLDQVAGREFSLPKQLDNRDSGRMRQSLEYTGLEAAKGVRHGTYGIIRIFAFTNLRFPTAPNMEITCDANHICSRRGEVSFPQRDCAGPDLGVFD